jgi:hypothetical protein
MKTVIDTLSTATGWLRYLTEFGLALIMMLIVVDILFPGTTSLVKNLGILVGQFSDKGLAGLVALLLFMLVFKGKLKE